MDKSRAKRVEHDKKRIGLIALVAIFSVSICVLGSMIGYKIYTKQSFEQRIETLKKEKDDQLSEGNQKDHFRKGQAEVIAYYPLQGEQVISSVKEIMTQDIKENLEDKENLVFYYTEKQDSTLKGIVNRSVMKQVYDLTSSKVEETEKKLLENAMIQVYKSVYSSTDNDIQKKINSVLSFDIASETTDEINKRINKDKNEEFFTVLSSSYQREQMKLGASGKLGIGVHSNNVTFQAQLERLYGTKNQVSIVEYDSFGNQKNKVITLGELTSDGILGKTFTIDGQRTISDVNAENQNSATDNVKAQIMGKRNENAYTINVLSLMTLRGFDLTSVILSNGKETKLQYSSLLISQPIIRRYVELKEQQKSLTADYSFNDEQKIIKQLIEEFNTGNVAIKKDENGNINKLDFLKSVTNNNYNTLTGQALYDNLDFSKSSNVQLQVLQAFFTFEEESKQVNEIQKLISLNTTGLGISYFNVLNRIGTLNNITSSNLKNATKLIGEYLLEYDYEDELIQNKDYIKDFIKVGNYYWKPTTTEGITLINSLSIANNLMGEFFPYKSTIISEIIRAILSDREDTNNQLKYEIMSSLRDFIYTSNLGLFSGNINSERKRLFFDAENNQSLASFINKIKNENNARVYFRNNQFLKNLDTIIDRTGNPSLIDSGVDNEINFSKSNRYSDFLKLLYDDNTILGIWNGEEITPRKLAQDLATYAFLANDEGGSIGFRNYVNQNYLDIIGVNGNLRDNSKNFIDDSDTDNYAEANVIKINAFIKQFYQHNPQYVTRLSKSSVDKINKSNEFQKDLKTGKLLSFRLIDEKLKPFLTVKNKNSFDLYEFREGTYYLIPTLGTFGFNEYNFYSNVNKTLLPDNDIYPQNKSYYESHTYIEPENNVVSSPKNITFADKFDISKGLRNLLETIINQGDNENHKRFLERLLPYLDQNVKVKIVDYIGEGNQGMSFKYEENSILISKGILQFLEETTDTNKDVNNILSEMILEEFVHSITINELGKYGIYDSNDDLIPNQDAPAFVYKIVKLYEEAKKVLPYNKITNENYYTKSLVEFMAGVFVADDFRNTLDNTVINGKSLLQRFKEAIRDLLRYITGATYTDETINSIMELLENKKVKSKEVSTNKENNLMKVFNIPNVGEVRVNILSPRILKAKPYNEQLSKNMIESFNNGNTLIITPNSKRGEIESAYINDLIKYLKDKYGDNFLDFVIIENTEYGLQTIRLNKLSDINSRRNEFNGIKRLKCL